MNGDYLQAQSKDVGIPKYIASGSHCFTDSRYRFLIMPRYKTDLHSIIKSGRLSRKHFLIVASQIIDVLMHLHEKNYVHSDIKAENIMIGICQTKPKSSTKCSVNQFNNMRSHNLRPTKSIAYVIDENSRSSNGPGSDKTDNDSEQDEDFELSPKKRKTLRLLKKSKNKYSKQESPIKTGSQKSTKNTFCKPCNPTLDKESDTDERVYVIDYGLATKFVNTVGETTTHKTFCCDERRAHDGTLEFTSRDAHFGAHSRRSDLECLG
jgi:serine/threonine protein kinase